MSAVQPAWALEQPLAALARANNLTAPRYAYRRELRAMTSHEAAAEIADVFTVHARGLECDSLDACEGDYVFQVLLCVRRIGKRRIDRLAQTADVPRLLTHDRLRVRELTAREALALADGLRLLYPTTPEASR